MKKLPAELTRSFFVAEFLVRGDNVEKILTIRRVSCLVTF